VWYVLRSGFAARMPFVERHAVALDVAALLLFCGIVTVQAAASGGVRHSTWLSFVFVVVFASSCLPLLWTPVFGVLSGGCVVLATAVAGALGRETAGDLALVGVGLPLLAVFATVLSSTGGSLHSEAERRRAELAAAVRRLSE